MLTSHKTGAHVSVDLWDKSFCAQRNTHLFLSKWTYWESLYFLRNITAISIQGILQWKIWRRLSSDTIKACILPAQTMLYKFREKLKTRDSLKSLQMLAYYCHWRRSESHSTTPHKNQGKSVALTVMWGHDYKLIFTSSLQTSIEQVRCAVLKTAQAGNKPFANMLSRTCADEAFPTVNTHHQHSLYYYHILNVFIQLLRMLFINFSFKRTLKLKTHPVTT